MPGVVGAAELASRRGFLIGLTIAEVMLITLFVLLLLFRHTQDKAEISEMVESFLGKPGVVAIQDHPVKSLIHPRMQERLDDIMVELINCRLENDPACANNATDSSSSTLVVKPEPDRAPSSIEEAMQEVEDMRKELVRAKEELAERDETVAEAQEDLEKLNEQIQKVVEASVPGAPPICTYDGGGARAGKPRGASISIGTFLLEPDGITLLATNPRFFEGGIVDWNGLVYDNSEAVKALLTWPLGVKLTLTQFEVLAKEFVRIGDIETATHKKCRFGALWYMELNEANQRIFDRIFLEYFYKGARERISEESFDRLRTKVPK